MIPTNGNNVGLPFSAMRIAGVYVNWEIIKTELIKTV